MYLEVATPLFHAAVSRTSDCNMGGLKDSGRGLRCSQTCKSLFSQGQFPLRLLHMSSASCIMGPIDTNQILALKHILCVVRAELAKILQGSHTS